MTLILYFNGAVRLKMASSTITSNISSKWSEIMNNQNNLELLDKQEEFIHANYLGVMEGLSGIR